MKQWALFPLLSEQEYMLSLVTKNLLGEQYFLVVDVATKPLLCLSALTQQSSTVPLRVAGSAFRKMLLIHILRSSFIICAH